MRRPCKIRIPSRKATKARAKCAPALLGLMTAASVVLASAQIPQDSRPVFRSGVRLVRLDVRVLDDQGRSIADLKPDEIQVTEGDVDRPIVLFQRVVGSGDSYVESAQRTIASEISTNEGAPQGHLFILLFDQDHIQSGNEQPVRARRPCVPAQSGAAHDRVAIYGLPGPGPAQSFTANIQTARLQLASVHGWLDRRATGRSQTCAARRSV